MTSDVLVWAMGIITVLSLGAALVAWISRDRWTRDYRAATAETVDAKNQHITALEQHVALVRDVDSVRMAERYIAAKKGLEDRSTRLTAELSRVRSRRDEAERKINDLLLDRETRGSEIGRLRSDLLKTQQDAQRLEQIVKAIYTVGPISIEEVKKELAARRRLSAHVKGRLEHLSLEGEARVAETERLKVEVEQCRKEAERLALEIEVTRSAGAILDGMLGIDAEVRDKLAPYVSERLEDSIRRLSNVHGRDPFAEIMGNSEREAERDALLLEAGAAGSGQLAGETQPHAGATTVNGEGARGEAAPDQAPAPAVAARPAADPLSERAEWLRSVSRQTSPFGGTTGTRP